jgi:beta-alanine degradation protein BauB
MLRFYLFAMTICLTTFTFAATARTPQFDNDKVNVWKTIIYPHKKEILANHRHDHDRVLVALDDGTLKVVSNTGQSHLLKLKRNTAYYLEKDIPNETHTDENISSHPIKVMVIELKN